MLKERKFLFLILSTVFIIVLALILSFFFSGQGFKEFSFTFVVFNIEGDIFSISINTIFVQKTYFYIIYEKF